jgi:hypothetical protein
MCEVDAVIDVVQDPHYSTLCVDVTMIATIADALEVPVLMILRRHNLNYFFHGRFPSFRDIQLSRYRNS